MNQKPLDDRIEDIGSKVVKLIEIKLDESKPKFNKLLNAFDAWLERKLQG